MKMDDWHVSHAGKKTTLMTKAIIGACILFGIVGIYVKLLLQGELEVEIEFTRSNRRRVDLDNLSKAVLDGMNGIVYDDDKQVVSLHLRKRYDREPGLYVRVMPDGECPF